MTPGTGINLYYRHVTPPISLMPRLDPAMATECKPLEPVPAELMFEWSKNVAIPLASWTTKPLVRREAQQPFSVIPV